MKKELAGADREFEELFRTQYSAITRAAFLVVGEMEQAKDIAQDAFLSLYLNWEKVRHYEKPGAWVRKVALRSAGRSMRAKGAFLRMLRLLTPSKRLGEQPVDLGEVLMALPPRQRIAVVLRYYQKATAKEIAEVLECSEATARVHVHRGRRQLAKLLGGEDEDVFR